MDPTSTEESTPWDPITGKLRAHAGLKLPRGTREALEKTQGGLGKTQGFSQASTRCPTGPTTAATSGATTVVGSPRRHSLADTLDLTQPGGMQRNPRQSLDRTAPRSSSLPRNHSSENYASGTGRKAVRFLQDQKNDPRAMDLDPGRYDVDTSPTRSKGMSQSAQDFRKGTVGFGSTGSRTFEGPTSTGRMAQTAQGSFDLTSSHHVSKETNRVKSDHNTRYDGLRRGSAEAREYEEYSKHIMHVKADPRNDMLNDGSGHNPDGDGQTQIGIEIKERFNDMKTAFLKIDEDFDGKITHEELMKACYNWNIPLSEATRVMDCVDTDDRGFIDFDQFARRFDPYLEVSADDDELLRLYQEGIMGNEQPITLTATRHGTSTADPLLDEAGNLRTENGDLRGRLARAMGKVKELDQDLKDSKAYAANLETKLDKERADNAELRGRNRELEGNNAELRRRLADAEDDRRRAEERARRLGANEDLLKDEADRLRRDREDDERRRRSRMDEDEDARRRAEDRRRLEDLERQLANDTMRRDEDDDDERNTVFVYGIDGCQQTDAVHKALKKAKVPFKKRDFNKDKRFMKVVTENEDYDGSSLYAPVVCLGDKAWWQNSNEDQLVPFPQSVALDLRRILGLNNVPDIVREDVIIDDEIYERFLTMQDAFLKLDDNRDGFITADELEMRCVQWNIPKSEAHRIIAETDSDGKGAIDFDEFARRFGGLFKSRCRGPLTGQAPMTYATDALKRPKT